jgi:hypothetical protein
VVSFPKYERVVSIDKASVHLVLVWWVGLEMVTRRVDLYTDYFQSNVAIVSSCPGSYHLSIALNERLSAGRACS